MHTILGAGGSVSPELAKLLTEKNVPVTLVSRSAQPTPYGKALAADISTAKGALSAVDGAEVAYLTVGLPYKLDVWQAQWPSLMQNIVNACIQTGTKLIFVDNIYMLSNSSIPHMTEDSPMQPSSKKGKVRAEVDNIFLRAVAEGKLNGIIARAADFYGSLQPFKSILLDLVIKRMADGKSPQWFYTVDTKHSFTYIPDIAQALYLMSMRPDAFNRIWNLPTAPAVTVRELIGIVNQQLGTNKKPAVMGEFMMTLLRLMIPALREMKELKYQVTQDYWLDSTAFEQFFNFTPTPYEVGIKQILTSLQTKK